MFDCLHISVLHCVSKHCLIIFNVFIPSNPPTLKITKNILSKNLQLYQWGDVAWKFCGISQDFSRIYFQNIEGRIFLCLWNVFKTNASCFPYKFEGRGDWKYFEKGWKISRPLFEDDVCYLLMFLLTFADFYCFCRFLKIFGNVFGFNVSGKKLKFFFF